MNRQIIQSQLSARKPETDSVRQTRFDQHTDKAVFCNESCSERVFDDRFMRSCLIMAFWCLSVWVLTDKSVAPPSKWPLKTCATNFQMQTIQLQREPAQMCQTFLKRRSTIYIYWQDAFKTRRRAVCRIPDEKTGRRNEEVDGALEAHR